MRTGLPALPGVYALILFRPRERRIAVGALGVRRFPAGWYVYVGSACGPGGLRGRVGHHLRGGRMPRWHIDFLRRGACLRELWCLPGAPAEAEHRWAALLAECPGASVPVPRFGASDCRCRAHLFAFRERPHPLALAGRLQGPGRPGGGPLLVFSSPPGTPDLANVPEMVYSPSNRTRRRPDKR